MSDQQFHGRIDQVAAGDIRNYYEAPQAEQKTISDTQRQILETLVQEISAESELDENTLWREVVHARVGVEDVGEIPREKFLEAQDALVCWRDNRRKQANIRMMVSRITSITKAKRIYDQRDAFCLRQFGEKHLNAMTTEQLRHVLVFVEDYQDAAKAASSATPSSDAPQSRWIEYKALVMQHPWQFGWTCVAGAFIGKVFL